MAPAKLFIQKVVIPNARLCTILLIVFQLTVAFFLLSRGALVKPGLIAGAIFAFEAVLVSNTTGAIANLAMSAVQLYLAFTS